MTRERPVRILQVVGGLNRGGTETWLLHVLRHIDRERFQIDFLVHSTQPGAYDAAVRALGSRIIPCLRPDQPWLYARNFKRLLHEYGPYDIVHSHVHHYTGYVLQLARQMGIPVRVAHSHSDTAALQASASPARRTYLRLMNHWIQQHATAGLAVSQNAAVALFGPSWALDPRWRVLYCGIDLSPFEEPVDRTMVRAELGVPPQAFVLGHVGRFAEPKNHRFLLAVAAEVNKRVPDLSLWLVGDGPLRGVIEEEARRWGLSERLVITGFRSDVPRLLRAMDTFLFPSLYEGLGLALVEAQAAGLPCVASDVIPDEADVVAGLVQRLSLSQSAAIWAEAILATRRNPDKTPSLEALRLVTQSALNIQDSVGKLTNFYADLCPTSQRESPVNEGTSVRRLPC